MPVGVEQILLIGRVSDAMRAIACGELYQAGAIEIDAAIVNVVGILLRIDAAGAKPDLTLLVVDAIDSPHHPLPLRDLILTWPVRVSYKYR